MEKKNNKKEYDKERYRNNSEAVMARSKATYQRRKDVLLPLMKERRLVNKLKAVALLGGRCTHCGIEYFHAAYDFHHVDPTTKEKAVGLLLSNNWDKIKPELEKCILLCKNCHSIHHYKDNNGEA